MNKYLGITIGPIISTIGRSRTTREMWASSYIFSYIIRNLTEEFLKKTDHFDVLLPTKIEQPGKIGAGLYPDRIILHILKEDKALEEAQLVVRNVVSAISEKIAAHLRSDAVRNNPLFIPFLDIGINDEEIKKQLFSFFQIYAVKEKLGDRGNIILNINRKLEEREQTPKIQPQLTTEFLFLFFNFLGGSFLFDEAFGDKNLRFKSLIEISAAALKKETPKDGKDDLETILKDHFKQQNSGKITDDDQLMDRIAQSYGDDMRQIYRYAVAGFVDGDAVGKIIEQFGTNKEHIKEFSKFMSEYALKSAQKVKHYGGLPVYAGGDDLFIFAPVYSIDEDGKHTHILQLSKDLDLLFQNEFKGFWKRLQKKDESLASLESLRHVPSLSFGYDISYYKSPLDESIQRSYYNLFEKAKKKPNVHKNAIYLTFTTHSGQSLEINLPLGRNSSEKQRELFDRMLVFINSFTGKKSHLDSDFLNALSRRLLLLDDYFKSWVRAPYGTNSYSLEPYFKRLIGKDDEKDAKEDDSGSFSKQISELIRHIYKTPYDEKHFLVKEPAELLNFIIRFIHQLNRKNAEE